MAIVATHPIQYQAPLWRLLAADARMDVRVLYGSDLSVRGYRDREFGVQVQWDTPLTTGYVCEFLERDPALQRLTFTRPSGRRMGMAFDCFRPHMVILNAYNGLIWLRALYAARVRGIPVAMRHEASDDALARSRVKKFLRDNLIRLLYSQISGFAAIGTHSRNHLLRMGVPTNRIWRSPYCIDSNEFERQYATWWPCREELRAALGIVNDDLVLIFSGKLIEKKQPMLIPRAIELLEPKLRRRIHLIVVGDGDQRAIFESEARRVLGSRLHPVGFVNQSEMGRWYTTADCLVLPSKRGAGETWGLVVNEAMQFGLVPVVSTGVGCHPDLVTPKTGVVFQSGDAASLSGAIAQVSSLSVAERYEMGKQARAHIFGFTCSKAADGLAAMITQVADVYRK